jgi:twinkle protein
MRPLSEMRVQAHEEMLIPFPSLQLPDWGFFNEATGGLRDKEFSIICGPTGSGKTTWLANLSMQLLMTRTPHFVASVETGPTDFVKRVMSALMRRDLNTGDRVPLALLQQMERDYGNILNTRDLWLSLYENRISVEALMADMERSFSEHGCKVAVLDNLNFFLEITSAQNAIVEMDRVTHELIMFCKRVPMHVIMVMHPKKTDGGRVETEFDIKGSSTAVQEAHNVLLFNRPNKEDQETYPANTFRELKFVKLRRKGGNVYRRIMYRNVGTYYAEEVFL